MLNDPQSVTVNGVATSLPLTGAIPTKRSYTSADGKLRLDVSQLQTKQRFRREFRLTQAKVALDPLTATNSEVSTSVIISVDEPRVGFTDAEIGYLIDGVKTAFSSTTYAKILGGEM